jgi:membrane associated rhomboid family serine protease
MIPYRDDNPTRRPPVIVLLLIAVNVAVFLWELVHLDQLHLLLYRYGLVPAAVFSGARHIVFSGGHTLDLLQPPWLAIFTSMFLHGGFAHIAGNMLYLWIFGDNMEDRLGSLRFLLFYFLCGLAAAGLQLLFSFGSKLPMLGASGAIAGVLGGYYVTFPRARVRTVVFLFFFVSIVTLPASFVLGLWFLLQLWGGTQSLVPGHREGVAFFAHIGGFVAGYLLAKVLAPPPRRRAP